MKIYILVLGLMLLTACTSTTPSENYFQEEDSQVIEDSKERYDISHLTKEQYAVTQLGATEPAFDNEFWDMRSFYSNYFNLLESSEKAVHFLDLKEGESVGDI